jgi:hypothetical protein
MKLLTSGLALVSFVILSAPRAHAATCADHRAGCHRHLVQTHFYHHYAAAGVVIAPPTSYSPPYGLADPDWRERGTLQLLFNGLNDPPFSGP